MSVAVRITRRTVLTGIGRIARQASNAVNRLLTRVAAAHDRAVSEPAKLLTATQRRARLLWQADAAGGARPEPLELLA